MQVIKALTISQPFADLIASGQKSVENRTWYTRYRGPLAIHAGKGSQYLDKARLALYPTGCIVAIVELVGCETYKAIEKKALDSETANLMVPKTELTWTDLYQHLHTEGPWCWIFGPYVRRFDPIRCSGKQGLWDVPIPDELLTSVR